MHEITNEQKDMLIIITQAFNSLPILMQIQLTEGYEIDIDGGVVCDLEDELRDL